jgi:hypothetical protein
VHLRKFFASTALLAAMGLSAIAQSEPQTKPSETPEKTQSRSKKDQQNLAPNSKDNKAPMTAETVAESAIIIYGGLGGRKTLDQIRKTSIERGKMSLVNPQGVTEPVNYERRTIRGENLNSEKIRADLEYPSIRYSLVRAGDKTFGLYNDTIFSPNTDATRQFEDQIFHGLEALLRYKENGSTLELAGHDKIMGVDFYFVDVTDKAGRKTRFYVSSKFYRVMMLEYEDQGVKYRRKFYDYRYAQGTLVPYRSTLTANGKMIEETEVSTVTFGQKVEEDLFNSGSPS